MKPTVLTELLRRSDAWVELPSGPAIITPARLGNHFRVTLTEDARLEPPHGGHAGQRILWRFKQDGTGSRTLSIGSGFRQTGTTVLASAAAAVTFWEASYDDTVDEWSLHGVPDLSSVYDPAGTAAAAIVTHVALPDPHTQYLLESVASTTYLAQTAALAAQAQGVATLAAGEATVADTGVTAGSRFILSRQLLGSAPGHLSVDTRSNGVSFHILSSDAGDDGTVFWQRFQP